MDNAIGVWDGMDFVDAENMRFVTPTPSTEGDGDSLVTIAREEVGLQRSMLLPG